MVVVDNARKMIGKTIDVVVTSVLQTTAGKMIFGRFIEPGALAQAQAAQSAAGVSAPPPPGGVDRGEDGARKPRAVPQT